MKQDNVNYLMVGVFVLAMLVVLMAALYKLTGRSSDTEPYYVLFSDITGIHPGSVITYGGYQIGQVEKIVPQRANGKTHYRAELNIQTGWEIPSDSVARIVSPGLLADNQIDILEGESKNSLPPGSAIKGESASSLMSLLDSVANEVKDLSQGNIKPLINNLNNRVNTIGDNLDSTIPELTRNLNQLIGRFNNNADQLAVLLGDDNQKHINNLFNNADTISQHLMNLSKGFNKASAQLDKLLENSNATLKNNQKDIRHSVVELRKSMEIVSQNIDSIVYNLGAASRNMNEFSREIRSNPGVLLRSKTPQDQEAGR